MIRYRNALFIPNIEIRRGGGEDPAFRSTSHLQHKSYYSHTNEKKSFCVISHWMKYWQSIFYLFPLYLLCCWSKPRLASTLGYWNVYSSPYIYSVKVPFRCSYNIRMYTRFNWNSYRCCCLYILKERFNERFKWFMVDI